LAAELPDMRWFTAAIDRRPCTAGKML